eukprot:g1814.t1
MGARDGRLIVVALLLCVVVALSPFPPSKTDNVFVGTFGNLGKLCLTLVDNVATNGGRLRLEKCVAKKNSLWSAEPVKGTSFYHLTSAASSFNACLDVVSQAGIVQVWKCAGTQSNQLFDIQQDGKLVSKSTSKCIGYKGHFAKPVDMDDVVLVDCHLKHALEWTYFSATYAPKKHDEAALATFNTLKIQEASLGRASAQKQRLQEFYDGEVLAVKAQQETNSGGDNFLLVKILFGASTLCFVCFCVFGVYFYIDAQKANAKKS